MLLLAELNLDELPVKEPEIQKGITSDVDFKQLAADQLVLNSLFVGCLVSAWWLQSTTLQVSDKMRMNDMKRCATVVVAGNQLTARVCSMSAIYSSESWEPVRSNRRVAFC